VLTAGPGSEWVFFINVPIGLVILLVIPTVVRRDISGNPITLSPPGDFLFVPRGGSHAVRSHDDVTFHILPAAAVSAPHTSDFVVWRWLNGWTAAPL
jgi:quercetin dioxygenase-like cupin family protein